MSPFGPIAIVGRALIAPGVLSPEELWKSVAAGQDLISTVPADRWGMDPRDVLCAGSEDSADRTWSDRGGYVHGFEDIFDPEGFGVPAQDIVSLDPVFQWTFHTAREALRDAGYGEAEPSRFGAVFGNLSFPSASMAAYTQATSIASISGYGTESLDAAGLSIPASANRFNSGLPALLLERALGLGSGAFALDAACASSLYAIKLACDRLSDRSSDLMLAGAVNCADDLCIHLGFTALQALSRSGQSRPFNQDADGLVPAEGCGFVALRRLEDAVRDGDTIHGIIRGIGLSNDGRGRGMLVPSSDGQAKAIRRAFEVSGLEPQDISLLECHATGTQVGDGTEIKASAEVYGSGIETGSGLAIGSLKSNTGHLITAAGVAGLIKVIEAMRHETRPPTLHANNPLDVLADSPFRLLQHAEPWDRATIKDGVLRAGVSAFGFGGNNAHLLVEEPASASSLVSDGVREPVDPPEPIAIVGVGVRAASAAGFDAFGQALFNGKSCLDDDGRGTMDGISLGLQGLKFPPNDLRGALGQQLAVLQVGDEALTDAGPLPAETTGIYVGMGTDIEAARFGVRWRLASTGKSWGCSPEWIEHARGQVGPVLNAAGVMGTMPNIVANRLNSQFDMRGPSFTVSAEERSGLVALDLAARALRTGEIDAALVGAVDLSCEPVHQRAAAEQLPADRQVPGDAAVVLVLKRLADATANNDKVYCVLPGGRFNSESIRMGDRPDLELGLGGHTSNIADLFGHAHAASGLLHVAAAVACLHARVEPGGAPLLASNPGSGTGLAEGAGPRTALVQVEAMDGLKACSVFLAEASKQRAPSRISAPTLHIWRGQTPEEVVEQLDQGFEAEAALAGLADSPELATLVIVAGSNEEFTARAAKARRHILEGRPPGQGVHFRSAPLRGEMAFVFTAAGAAYEGMGRELLLALPELLDSVSSRFPLGDVAGWIYQDGDDRPEPTPNDYLWGTSLLSQAHVRLSLDILNLKPTAAIGYSSGESNSLFAFDVWTDMDQMRVEINASGMMDHELGVDFAAIARAWGLDSATWAVWNVLAPLAEVQDVVARHDRVHVAIINTANDVVIGGDTDACNAVVDELGPRRCLSVGYNLACHVPEVGETFRQPWLDIHTRSVSVNPAIRYYSNGVTGSYEVATDTCARAITSQAVNTLDFPATIEAAYADGVRIFVEHGPAGACTNFIGEILTGRDVLCIQLDRREANLAQVFEVAAALIAAGVQVDVEALTARLSRPSAELPGITEAPTLDFASHPPPFHLPPRPNLDPALLDRSFPDPTMLDSSGHQHMVPAPELPPVGLLDLATLEEIRSLPTVGLVPRPSSTAPVMDVGSTVGIEGVVREHFAALASMHEAFVHQQSQVHGQFLAFRANLLDSLAGGTSTSVAKAQPTRVTKAQSTRVTKAQPTRVTKVQPTRVTKAQPTWPIPQVSDRVTFSPTGPVWNKEQLKIHSSGKISELFGPLFEPQDQFELQCRMPEPPLLLADRVTGLEAEAGVLGQGKMWTETDINEGDWYLNDGYMPAGFMIESGQADLMLISYMGIDLLNQGERVYRLLGCTLTYHGDLPSPGETLEYEIRINGHAKHGDVRLFFFEYDCIVNGERRLTVRDAQAGFFSHDELADALGVLWTPEKGLADLATDARLDAPLVVCTKSSFTSDEVAAFSNGQLLECFGPGYEWAQTHTRSPKVQSGEQLFIDSIPIYEPTGGPWGRGFMRCETKVQPDDWFFQGHFKNDPCMPGNFMVEACIEALSFYLAAAGYTTKRDGWRFQPLPDQAFDLKCRGEINPRSDLVAYEIHVEEIWDGPHPTVIADVVGFVDGEAAFHAHRLGVELVPGWPLTTMPEVYRGTVEPVSVATDHNGFPFDWKAMISCAWGRPSEAFGSMYKMFDGIRQSPRLPGEPYHFISRIISIDGELDICQAGMKVVCEYDIPDDVWYFNENGAETMPHAVLLEAALQPCGWVASAVGSVTKLDDDLMFRNLDGTGTVMAELTRTAGVLRTHVTITDVSVAGGMVIESFDVQCFLGDTKVYEMETVFGFFPPEAFDNQVGLPIKDEHRHQLEIGRQAPARPLVDLTTRPDRFCGGSVRLAEPMLLMVDRAVHVPKAGEAGLGIIRGEKDVDVSEWFFKAHFFQDPVQPGSLGIEALIQLLQFYMLDSGMDKGIDGPGAHFEPLKLGDPLTWKYRGQVTPKNALITSTMEITEVGADDVGPYVIGKGSLWVDGLRIYEASNMGMRITQSRPESPVTVRPIEVEGEASVVLKPGPELSGMVRDFWNPFLGTPHSWAGEDIVLGLLDQYLNRLIVTEAATLDRLRGQPAIYVANHQVQIESLIITHLIPALTGVPMTTLANAKHQQRWIGELIDTLESYPDFRPFKQIAYFDQDRPDSMFRIVDDLRSGMRSGTHSFLVHSEGTRARSCREQVTRCSSVFIDLALELNVPIVPVSFTGGLPVEPVRGKLDLPVGHGSQDYWIGPPIEPAELGPLTLRNRVGRVVSAINELGPSPATDEPLPGNGELESRVEAWQKRTGSHQVFAAIWEQIKQAPGLSEETAMLRSLVASRVAKSETQKSQLEYRGNRVEVAASQDPLHQWLEELADLLLSPSWQAPVSVRSRDVCIETIPIVVNKATHPHLYDHAVDGSPVIPVVLVLEWFERAAFKVGFERGQHVQELTELQVLKGIVLDTFDDGADLNVLVRVREAETGEGHLLLDLALAGNPRLHYRAKAVLGPQTPSAQGIAPTLLEFDQPLSAPPYGGVLFHGPAFQVLDAIGQNAKGNGLVATVRGVVDGGWPAEDWLSDPAALDGLLQLALLWTEQVTSGPSLPTKIGRVRLWQRPTTGGYSARLIHRGGGKHRAICDAVLYDNDGERVAELLGIETHVLPNFSEG